MRKRDLSYYLDEISVQEIESRHTGPLGWFGVCTPNAGGFIAYFRDEKTALYFRLVLVNQALNGLVDQGMVKS